MGTGDQAPDERPASARATIGPRQRRVGARGRFNVVLKPEQSASGRPTWPSLWVDQSDEPEDAQPPTTTVIKPETEVKPVVKPLLVKKVDLWVVVNTTEHHTDEYEITDSVFSFGQELPARLVIRRGQDFDITIDFDRPYDERNDTINITFDFGHDPKVSKATSRLINLKRGLLPRKWSGQVLSAVGKSLTLRLRSSPETFIGQWTLRVDTLRPNEAAENEQAMNVRLYTHLMKIYIIFNPWCKDDQVFMSNEIDRDEYVMNNVGIIYTGNQKQIGARPWKFGQFEDFMLDCCMFLLDISGLSEMARHDPIRIARAISRVVNSQDLDAGVLMGNWSGDYEGGTAPTAWVSSNAILEQFWTTKESVAYGQCWVFSGVVTSVSRCLGLPCRSVTNFSSAHDCDGSVSIDYHFRDAQPKPEPMSHMNEDSVWNFHVWNEVWMSRPDLGPQYAGWQALDATPQETSDGMYQAGPCPVIAVKRGVLTVPYDAPFIFAEVNADKVYWFLMENGDWKSNMFKKNTRAVGKFISTKRPRKQVVPADYVDEKWCPKRLDITDQYKFKEGSEEERAAVYRANMTSTLPNLYDDPQEDDVTFELSAKDNILVGSNFDITVTMSNKSRSERTVKGSMTLKTSFYTGVPLDFVKIHDFEVTMESIRAGEAVMHVKAEDYVHLLLEQCSFRVTAICFVTETTQRFADDDTFRLRRPDLIIEAPTNGTKATVQQEFTAKVTLKNPLPITLTQCKWQLEGDMFDKIKHMAQSDIGPHDEVTVNVVLRVRKTGDRQFMASFTSKELTDVTGAHDITVQ